MQAKAAIRKVFELQRDGKGYAMLEILAPCPTNFRMDAQKAARFCIDEMEREFPLGVFRDRSAQAGGEESAAAPAQGSVLAVRPVPHFNSCAELFGASAGAQAADGAPERGAGMARLSKELRFKFAGYGGQGILSLGLCVAEAARLENLHTLWFPSYGPEQRGGSASCSVVVSPQRIGAPSVEHPDVLVCMNQPSYERFAEDVKPGGLVIVDETVPVAKEPPEGVRLRRVPAIAMAEEFGVPKAANTMMLAALKVCKATGLADASLEEALCASFKKKPQLIEKNREIFHRAAKALENRNRLARNSTTICGKQMQKE